MFDVEVVVRLAEHNNPKNRVYIRKNIKLPFAPFPGLGLIIDSEEFHIKSELDDSVYWHHETCKFVVYVHHYCDDVKWSKSWLVDDYGWSE